MEVDRSKFHFHYSNYKPLLFNHKPKNTMTRKHFQAVAERLNEAIRLSQNLDSIIKLATSLADDFEQFNPNFNRSKFLAVALA